MAIDTPAHVAVIGAGPIGLEAALYARYLGYDVTIFERGEIGENVRRWQHVRMFTPWKALTSPLGRRAIEAQGAVQDWPDANQFPTGRQWLEDYLLKLAQTDLLVDSLRTETSVESVSRTEWLKTDTQVDRRDWTLRLLVRSGDGAESSIDADVVFDTSGVLRQPNHFGAGGGLAVGESAVSGADRLWRYLPDIGGADRESFAGRRTLVIGGGASAATAILELVQLAEEEPGTHATWILRRRARTAAGSFSLVGRSDRRVGLLEFMGRVQDVECADLDSLEIVGESWTDALELANGEWTVRIGGDGEGTWSGSNVLALTGYRPDWEMCRELQIDLSPVWECSLAMERWLAGASPNGTESKAWRLVCREPDYYVLGAKSYGRWSDYVFAEGLRQVRDLFARIGDREDLDLYASIEPGWETVDLLG